MDLVAHFTNAGSPLVSPGDLPTIIIRELTGDTIISTGTMIEVGEGSYRFSFVTTPTLNYSARADGDPAVSGQLPLSERYRYFDAFSGIVEENIVNEIPAIRSDIAALPTAINSNLSVAHGAGSWVGIATDVGSIAAEVNALLTVAHGAGAWTTATGFAVPGDNMGLTPAALTAINSTLSVAHGAGSWVGIATDVGSIAAEVNAVLSGAHGAGSWETATTTIVQLGMLALGYTAARATNLDNLNTPISSVAAQISALNDVSVAQILNGVVDATGVTTITVQRALQFSFASLVNTVARFGQVYVYHDVGGSPLWAGFDNDPVSWGSSIV